MDSINAETTKRKERMEWLDAMRGFTMILVVAYHVAQMGFDQSIKHSSSLSFLMLFRMPLFFFVSGFLAYSLVGVGFQNIYLPAWQEDTHTDIAHRSVLSVLMRGTLSQILACRRVQSPLSYQGRILVHAGAAIYVCAVLCLLLSGVKDKDKVMDTDNVFLPPLTGSIRVMLPAQTMLVGRWIQTEGTNHPARRHISDTTDEVHAVLPLW